MIRKFSHSSLFLGFFLKKIPLFLLLLTAFCSLTYSQNLRKTNLEIFEQEISGELDKFFFYPQIERDHKFVFFVSSNKNNKEEKKFIESLIRKNAEKDHIKYAFSKDENMDAPDSIYNKCGIRINKLKAEYTKLIKNGFLGEKTMQRRITSDMDINISNSRGTVLVNDAIRTSYHDEIPYNDYSVYQSSEYVFTQAIPPNISFFETIIFPATVITFSAVAAILFFTIRSK